MADESQPDGELHRVLSIQPFRDGTRPDAARDHRMYHDCHPVGCRALVLYKSGRDFYGFNLMSVVIEAENISKRFFLGERNQRAFFEDIAAKSLAGFRRLLRSSEARIEKDSARDFWALRDI